MWFCLFLLGFVCFSYCLLFFVIFPYVPSECTVMLKAARGHLGGSESGGEGSGATGERGSGGPVGGARGIRGRSYIWGGTGGVS